MPPLPVLMWLAHAMGRVMTLVLLPCCLWAGPPAGDTSMPGMPSGCRSDMGTSSAGDSSGSCVAAAAWLRPRTRKGRVLLLDAARLTVLHVWKAYRSCQLGLAHPAAASCMQQLQARQLARCVCMLLVASATWATWQPFAPEFACSQGDL